MSKVQEVLEIVKNMTFSSCRVGKACEEEFGVTAAAPWLLLPPPPLLLAPPCRRRAKNSMPSSPPVTEDQVVRLSGNHRSRPQGSQGSGRRRSQTFERRSQEEAKKSSRDQRSWRHRRNQIACCHPITSPSGGVISIDFKYCLCYYYNLPCNTILWV